MAAVAINPISTSRTWEDSRLLQRFCCVPLLGTLPRVIVHLSLQARTSLLTGNPREEIALLKVQQPYRVAGAVRGLLSIACLVAGIALNIFTAGPAMLYIAVYLLLTGIEIASFKNTERVIINLENVYTFYPLT